MRKPIQGAGGSQKQQTRTPVEAPDSLHSISRAHVLDAVSEGEIYGFNNPANPFSCVFYDGTPVANADGSKNFKDFQIESRVGTQDQEHIPGFPSVENEIGVGLKITTAISYTRSLTNLDLDGVRIRLSVPILTATDTTNGDIKGTSVYYKISVATDGGAFVAVLNAAFTGKTTSKYERSHRIDLPKAVSTGWVVKVERITPDSTTTAIQNEMWVESITEIIDGKFRYPNTALVAHKMDSAQFQRIPERAYFMKGRIIKVPANYDPVTRVYATTGTGTTGGVWDGTFKPAWTNNPAWIFYDIVTNDRYGLGALVTPAMVDKWSLYEIARYCDELVPDGNGGTEPRFTCSIYLQTQSEAFKVIQDLASVFRGITYWANGTVVPVADKPSDPVYLYSPANVVGGVFKYSGSGKKARHTVAIVTYNDITDFSRQKLVYVPDREGIARYGINPTNVIAVGATSPGQARRFGKHILATERYESQLCQWGVGLDGSVARPGQVVKIADPLKQGGRYAGRIRTSTTTVVTVDKFPSDIAAGDLLSVILPTAVSEQRTVQSFDATAKTITVTAGFSAAPTKEAMWLLERPGVLYAQQFRVLNVALPPPSTSDGSLMFALTGLQHEPDKYAFIDADDPVDVLETFAGVTIPAVPSGLTLTAFTKVGHNQAFQTLNADWFPAANAARYEIQWQKDNGPWSAPQRVADSNFDYESATRGTYRYRVWAVAYNGIMSAYAVSPSITVDDAKLPVYALEIDGGLVTVDCRYTQFTLDLTSNVLNWDFLNESPQDSFIVKCTQQGAFDIAFPSNVSPVSGQAFVTTKTPGAVDIFGLATMDGGVTWDLTFGQQLEPLGVQLSPSPAVDEVTCTDGVTPVAPGVAMTATATGATGTESYLWERIDTNGGTSFTINNGTTPNPTIYIPGGTTAYNATQTWRCTVTDGSRTAQAAVDITLRRALASGSGGGGGGGGGTTLSATPDTYTPAGSCIAEYDPGLGKVVGCAPSAIATLTFTGLVGTPSFTFTRTDAGTDSAFSTQVGQDSSGNWYLQWSAGLAKVNMDRTQTWTVSVYDNGTGQSFSFPTAYTVNLTREYIGGGGL